MEIITYPNADNYAPEDERIRFFHGLVDGLVGQIIAIDKRNIIVLDRKSRFPKLGYEYFEKLIPYTNIRKINLGKENSTKRVIQLTLGIVIGLSITALMVYLFSIGVVVLGLISIIGPIIALFSAIALIRGPGLQLKCQTDVGEFKVVIEKNILQYDYKRIVDHIVKSNVEFHIDNEENEKNRG